MQDTTKHDPRIRIPAIHKMAADFASLFPCKDAPGPLMVRLARRAAELLRQDPNRTYNEALLREVAEPLLQPGPKAVINGTGILLHTNLGRSPLPQAWIQEALQDVYAYTNLEMDLHSGKRSHRDQHFTRLAQLVWGVEDATLVNNAAAGVSLTLAALGAGGETLVSRGELIEIGGSYRLPDIMSLAGSQLREVGTTNKTRIGDYESAISEASALLLKTHTSNYRIEGFTASVPLEQLVALGRAKSLPVVMDLGSGLSSAMPFPPVDEPFIEQYLEADPDVMIFSGDKLFGSIQAGIIVGKKAFISRIRKHPMMRMLRADKLSIAVLCKQLRETVFGNPHPLSILANTTVAQLRPRAEVIVAKLAHSGIHANIMEEDAFMGGGSLPQEKRDTLALVFKAKGLDALARRLRLGTTPVVGYIRNDALYLNLASVLVEQDEDLTTALIKAMTH